jgi:hypothetical protein
MIPQFTNTAANSFLLWAEHNLLSQAQAYKNYTSRLYYYKDLGLESAGYVGYSSPFKQWVYDSSVSGATICSGIFGQITLNKGQSGLKIDYENGRAILPLSLGTGLKISGHYAFKDINVYLPNETQESVLTSNKFYLNSRFNRFPTGGIAPYVQATPALFFNNLNNRQDNFALGGLYNSVENFSFIVMVENVWMLDGIISFFRDKKNSVFPQISMYEHPIDEFGDIKTGLYPSGYSYQNLIQQYGQPGNLIYFDTIRASKVSDRIKTSEFLFLGILDIELSKVRTKT